MHSTQPMQFPDIQSAGGLGLALRDTVPAMPAAAGDGVWRAGADIIPVVPFTQWWEPIEDWQID